MLIVSTFLVLFWYISSIIGTLVVLLLVHFCCLQELRVVNCFIVFNGTVNTNSAFEAISRKVYYYDVIHSWP